MIGLPEYFNHMQIVKIFKNIQYATYSYMLHATKCWLVPADVIV